MSIIAKGKCNRVFSPDNTDVENETLVRQFPPNVPAIAIVNEFPAEKFSNQTVVNDNAAQST